MSPISQPGALYQLLFILSTLRSVVALPPSSIWQVNIDESPAPPPESGPPLSANAVRNTAYLPYDLIAIFGSYLISVIIVGAAILTIGRRRRAIQRSPRSLGMDMMKPELGLTGDGRPYRKKAAPLNRPLSQKLFGPSPVSPSKFWATPNLSIKHGWENVTGKSSKKSSVAGISIVTTDESVVDDDKRKNEIEMDRLYAAVAEHEAAKDLGVSVNEILDSSTNPSPQDMDPPELQHLRHGMRSLTGPTPSAMVDPYPSRTSTTSPRADTTSPPHRAASSGSGRRLQKKTPPPPLSINTTALSSRSSLASANSRSMRHYPISPPIGSPGMAPDFGDMYDDAEPLTPRAYAPGPPPLPPIATNTTSYRQEREIRRHRDVLASPMHPPDHVSPRRTHFVPSIRSSRASSFASNHSVGLPRSPREPLSARTATFPRTIPEQPSHESSMRNLTLPQSHEQEQQQQQQQQQHSQSYASDIKPGFNFSLSPAPTGRSGKTSPTGSTQTSVLKRERRRPSGLPQLTIDPASNHGSTTNLNMPTSSASMRSANSLGGGNLPLRTTPLPLRDARSPTSARPPSMIKATVLDRPAKRGAPGALLRAPGTAGLAGPATPYSPFYMPQTPMTPMTPSRLVGREERRKREKEEGRRVLTQEDVVVEEDEMWGDGWK